MVRTWDATNSITKAILSSLPLVPGAEGALPEQHVPELDRIWEQGFKRLNEVLPDCT
ncbi:hypothetical protein [Streptomyces sp. TRM70350]|uniref:hypothetical protein n=1 Tax=Streptomyces sp. TRM70350 TaxID=2856165 RepID=UPI001C48119A|nr:hypothetical protein [Streptomyces sp. TRM70350]MBV7694276.1 hypothetical protein [Streptomyces sp. TRM70350]